MAAAQDIIPKKLVIPTGFEPAERAIELRQQLAQALLEQGMTPDDHMISPLQVLGKMAQEFVGIRGQNRAMKEQGQLDHEIRGAYQSTLAGINHDVNSGMPLKDLVQKYAGNPMAEEFIKPYADAYAEGLKNRQAIVQTNGTRMTAGDAMGIPNSNPGDPVKATTILPGGGYVEQADPTSIAARGASSANAAYPVRLAVGQNDVTTIPGSNGASVPSAQPPAGGVVTPSAPPAGSPPLRSPNFIRQQIATGLGKVESGNRDFNPDGSPVRNRITGALYKYQVLPSTARAPGFGVMPARDQSAAEYDRVGMDYFDAMMKRYHNQLPTALSAYNAGPGTVDHALAAGHPLPAGGYVHNVMSAMGGGNSRPPDGMTTDGQPYWMVNGQAYDNAEGR